MKRSELAISALLVPLDAAAVYGAFMLSYYVRVESGALPVKYVLPTGDYALFAAAATLLWLVIFALLGLYRLRSNRRGMTEFAKIVAGSFVGTLSIVALIFFLRVDFFSRFVVLFGFLAAIVLLGLVRGVVRLVQQGLFRYGIGVRRAVVIGTGSHAKTLARELTRQGRGYQILGFVATKPGPKGKGVIGRLRDVPSILERYRPDELIDADPNLSGGQKLAIMGATEDTHTDFRFVPSTPELATARVGVAAVGGIPLMTLLRTPLEGWGRIGKRAFDLVGGILILPFFLLLYPFIALAIKLDSPGPVLLPQKRVGRQGQLFNYHKFRSMTQWRTSKPPKRLLKHNEVSGPVFKMKDDPRVTKVGRMLRKTSLDELPQVLNVLKGDMSLVGPRPPLPHEVKQYNRQQRRRLTIKPGITGPWQVAGRSDIGFDEWMRLDLYYIQHWSLLLDLTILLKTIRVVFSRKGAY
ncbi:MAG TPA: sugar transferase [Patescibacteria group bacterium]|jgi:exopolysaccharide biosynthesis polyprenyl glycosylphosphotransferase